jgi:hypothetical protein
VLSDGALPDLPSPDSALNSGLASMGDSIGSVQAQATETWVQDGDGPFLLREKTHTAAPMTLDQALYEMELVGHDFFLFEDRPTGQACVLYRRRGYSYGLIRLDTSS